MIDPGLAYSTFLGGGDYDWGNAIAVDSEGNTYVTGWTESTNFPTMPGAFDTTFNGGGAFSEDAFVSKVNAAGSALVYSTFLGGRRSDYGYGIAVDSQGNAYVTGLTGSTDFPTTRRAYDTTYSSVRDAFITKIDPMAGAPRDDK